MPVTNNSGSSKFSDNLTGDTQPLSFEAAPARKEIFRSSHSENFDVRYGDVPPDRRPMFVRSKTRSLSESSYSYGNLKGILKHRDRTVSECQNGLEAIFNSGDLPTTDISTDSEECQRETCAKTVRFSDRIQKQVFRTNASILGRRHKNQKKAEKKRRAQERRLSDSEAHDSSAGPLSDSDADAGVCVDSDLSRSLDSLTIHEEEEEIETKRVMVDAQTAATKARPKRERGSNAKPEHVSDEDEMEVSEIEPDGQKRQQKKRKKKQRQKDKKNGVKTGHVAEAKTRKLASPPCDSDSGTSTCDHSLCET